MNYVQKVDKDIKDMVHLVNYYLDSNENEKNKLINSSEIVENIKKNSLKSKGAKSIKVKKERKHKLKVDMKKFLINLTITIAIVSGTIQVANVVNYHNKIEEAHDYMVPRIVSYLEESDLSYVYLSENNQRIVFTEYDEQKLEKVYEKFVEDGFKENEAIYAIYKICGEDSVEQFVRSLGYDSFDSYLDDYYFDPVLAENAETDYGRYGNPKKFENNSEAGYLRRVSELQLLEEGKLLEHQNKSRGGKK